MANSAMSKKKPEAPDEGAAQPKSSNLLDRLDEGLQSNPKKLATMVAAVVLVGLVAKLGWDYFASSAEESADAQYSEVLSAGGGWTEFLTAGVTIDAQRKAEDRLAALEDVSEDARSGEYGPYYLWLKSSAAYEAAETAEDPDDKLRYYQTCLDATSSLISDYSDRPWVKIPWKQSQTQEIHPSLAVRRKAYVEGQIKFIEDHKAGVGAAAAADGGVESSITLTDANDASVTHTLKIRVFSKSAPYAVEQFLKNIAEKRWEGTHVYGLLENDPNTATVDGVLLGSPLSRSPWGTDVHGTETDWPGFTLPIEPNRQPIKRGTIAFDLHRDNGQVSGVSPSNLVIHLSDVPKTAAANQTRAVFAEIVDDEAGEAALTWLENLAYDDTKRLGTPAIAGTIFAPKLQIKVTSATSKGAPDSAPAVPLQREWVDPDQPEKPAEEPEKKPADDKKKPEDGGKK